MRRPRTVALLLLGLALSSTAQADERPSPGCDQRPWLQRFAPAGGWFPYGGGLVRWWPSHCFPCAASPDDYCRKPLPPVCWPPYPPYYFFGTPAASDTHDAGDHGQQAMPPSPAAGR